MMRDSTVAAGLFGVAIGLLAAWVLDLHGVSTAWAFVGMVLFAALHAYRAQHTRRSRSRRWWPA